MPKELERKLKKEYKNLPTKEREHAVYGTINKIEQQKKKRRKKRGRR